MIEEKTWHELVHLAEIWANAETMYEPPLPSITRTLQTFYGPKPDETIREITESIHELGCTDERKQNIDHAVKIMNGPPEQDFSEKINALVQQIDVAESIQRLD